MIENFDVIKENVLILGDFEESPKLDLQIQMIIDECLAYCYRKDVPSQMVLPLSDVIVSVLNKRSLIGLEGNVASYSEGDMSVSFGSNTNISNQFYDGKLEPFKQIIGVVEDV